MRQCRNVKSTMLLLLILLTSMWLLYLAKRHVRVCEELRLAYIRPASDSGTHQAVNAPLTAFGSVCHTPQCIAKYESTVNRPTRVPAIRHILWKTDRVSSYFAKQLQTWTAIHPGWQYVLWRDVDLENFVRKYYRCALAKYKSLPMTIMRIDMIRYMILHKFGGVYADLDYVLLQPLDRFLKFPAVVTREAEAHALMHFGMSSWPPPMLGNPAFMMSAPGHPFFQFCIRHLANRPARHVADFAGPRGLSSMLRQYADTFHIADYPDGVVIVPASRSFYGFWNNSMTSSTSMYKSYIVERLRRFCEAIEFEPSAPVSLVAYCTDLDNFNPITDRNEPMYAMHDHNKLRSSYDPVGSLEFQEDLVDIRSVLPNIVTADTIF